MAINNFQISPQLNPNKIFILKKSEVEKRFDPAFYYELRTNKFEFSHPSKTISRIVKSFSGGTPDKSIQSYWNGNICWASPKDMKDFYLIDTQDKTTPEGIKNSSASVAPIGSILIVFRSGILQHTLPVAITKVETAINQDLKVLVPSEEILSEYLATFLTTFEKRILPRIVKHSTTVQSINQEEFNQLPIPIPSIDI
jgi:restriction endonuclease S subunit